MNSRLERAWQCLSGARSTLFEFALASQQAQQRRLAAMWRPLQIILYDWWPIRRYARLYSNLATMPVELVASTEPEWEVPTPTTTKARYAAVDR